SSKDDIDRIALEIKNDIDNDKTLTTKEKTKQKTKVDSDAVVAKQNIDAAQDAQSIVTAHEDGEKQIRSDHRSNTTSISDQKGIAKDKIDQKAVEIKNDIDNDATLTTSEKTKQKTKVDSDAAVAKQNIDAAQDAQGIENARDEGIDQIESDHVSNKSSLEDQKQSAKDKIDQEAVTIKKDIENDITLTTAEKSKQKAKVDADAKAAKDKIDTAANAQEVNEEIKAGITAIDNDHIPNTASLEEQRQSAKDKIDQEAVAIKKDIENDATLTTAEKSKQKAKVDDDAKTAKGKIDATENAQEIIDELKAGVTAIDADHVPNTISLDEQKQSAKNRIDQEAKTIKAAIKADQTLTDDEKSIQISNVDADAKTAKEKIDTSTNAQAVINATNDGITTIDNDYVPNDSTIVDQKQGAKDRIDQEAIKIKDAISQDLTLDAKTKSDQINAVIDAANAAKANIDAAVNAQGIKTARDRGIIDIDSKHRSNPFTLVEQKDYAKQLIRDEAEIVKVAINSDPNLDAKTKADQIKAVDAQAQKAIDRIAAANDAQAVQVEYANGITALHAQHLSGVDLASQKKDAQETLDKEASMLIDIVTNDTSLDADSKASQINNIKSELQKAKNAIDRAKTSQEISDKEIAGITAIDAQHVPGKSLSEQKSDAAKSVDNAVETAKAQINQSKNITDMQKAKANQAIDDAANNAKILINAAQNSQLINKARTDGITAINEVVKTNNDIEITTLKQITKEAIDAEAEIIRKAINNDANLTKAEKSVQLSNVDLEVGKAKNSIDRAATVSEINTKQDAGITAVDAQYVPGKPLATQKADAIREITDIVNSATDKIDKDQSKTVAEKIKEKQDLADALTAAKNAINKANDAEEVNKAKADGIAGIDVAQRPVITLNDQKEAAKDVIDRVANTAKNTISQSSNLSNEQKAAANKAIDNAAAAAKDVVDKATDSDGIEKAKADGTAKINQIVDDTVLQAFKDQAKNYIKNSGNDVKGRIDNTHISDSEKKAIKDKIDQITKDTQAKIDAAKSEMEIFPIVSDYDKVVNSFNPVPDGSGSNGSGSNGSGSNGSDSQGSNGSGSNGSGSNGSGSNGSGSNGSGSNGSGSNGSGSNGSGSNGSGS
ncbi:DUF1542 domain-containing protein, partial [Lactobacillus sp. B4010]